MPTDRDQSRGEPPVEAAEVDGAELATTLGAVLRRHRKERGLTLQQLADRCGLSQPFLSQLENGRAMPSLLALHQVAAALETSPQELLQPHGSDEIRLVRAADNPSFELGPGTTISFLIEGSGHSMQANLVVAQPGAKAVHQPSHNGEETVYVLEGSMSVLLEGHDPVDLDMGDAYAYPAHIPHEWWNRGDVKVEFLFISVPPSF